MSTDDDADEDGAGIGRPLPPDDRLWRHPSELTAWGRGGSPGPSPAPVGSSGRGIAWPLAAVAALAGAALCASVLALTGTLSAGGGKAAVEKVAVSPIVSSPLTGDERSVEVIAEALAPAVAHLMVKTAAGTTSASGVVFRDDGMLFTSAHAIAGATSITVVLADSRRFEAKVVGADLLTDVGVLSIDADDLTVAVLGTSEEVAVGSLTCAIGWPGHDSDQPAVTTGVVSGVERRLDFADHSLHGLIQTDAPIEPAWSGGPLVDANGSVIGITTDLAGARSGFGFATPIDLVRRIAMELIESGKVLHPWLGIEGADLTMAQAESMGVAGGASIKGVAKGGPAARMGLQAHDVITQVGGHSVSSSSELVLAVRQHRPGDQVVVGYWRDGRYTEITITIEERP